MKKLNYFCLALTVAFNVSAAVVELAERVDEFSDEVEYVLMFFDDSESSAIGVSCNNDHYIFLIMPNGMWETKDYVDVDFRFDKNE